MVTFTINIPQMLAYIPYMDPMGSITKWDEPLTKWKTALFHCPVLPWLHRTLNLGQPIPVAMVLASLCASGCQRSAPLSLSYFITGALFDKERYPQTD